MRTQEDFQGLAFPVIRVRFAGPTDHLGSRYIATLRRGPNEIVRATASYNHALGPSENAQEVARACWNKYSAAHEGTVLSETDEPRIFVPGDLDSSSYSFTVVPSYFFAAA